MLAKRRKKDRGRFSAARRKHARITRLAVLRNTRLRKGWSKISDFSKEKFRHCRKESFEGDTRRCSHRVLGITHFYKNARKTLAFSGCLFCLWLILSLGVLREQLGSISCTKNREPAYASVFSACLSVLPRSFFLLFGSSFFFLSRKKEEK